MSQAIVLSHYPGAYALENSPENIAAGGNEITVHVPYEVSPGVVVPALLGWGSTVDDAWECSAVNLRPGVYLGYFDGL